MVAEATSIVREETGIDPCDLAHWAGPEDADWVYVMAISRKLWALLRAECDPINSLDREPGDALS